SDGARRGSALVVVLLLLVVAAVVAAFFVLRGNETSGVGPSTMPSKSAAAPKAGKPEEESGDAAKRANVASTDPDAAPPNGPSSPMVCFDQDAANKPLAGVEVVATPLKRTEADPEHAVKQPSDAAGIAKFEKLPYLTYEVTAAPPGRCPLMLSG